MHDRLLHSLVHEEETPWKKNRKLIQGGFKDLEYLPPSRTGWNATLSGLAFSARRQRYGTADLNLWAVMHGRPASGRYEMLGENALVLWHGTSAKRALKIREAGLFHKRGLWTTKEPRIAHGYTRSRSQNYGAGSAMVVLLLDSREIIPGIHYTPEGTEIYRFHSCLPPETVEYILWNDRIDFCGESRADEPKTWGIFRFKRKEGRWSPLSRPPVRFDSETAFGTKEEWLHLSIRRILSTLGSASAIEIFSSLYSTIAPPGAIEHDEVFRALGDSAKFHRQKDKRSWFSLATDVGCGAGTLH